MVVGVCLLAFGRPASAKLCGDDVQGEDVPCACGDVLVSNLVLSDDPVVAGTCDGDGLVVRAPGAGAGLRIDLNGKTLRGGRHGTAIWVVDGGPGGAQITSSTGRAAIEGFRDGVIARGDRGVILLENLDVRGCGRDGVRVNGTNYDVRGIEVSGVGRDGISLSGRDYRCDGTGARQSKRFGYFLDGQNAIIGKPQAGNTAAEGGDDGFHLMGNNIRLNACVASGNRKDGVSLRGAGHEVTGCAAGSNGEDGIAGDGGGLAFYGNSADGNGRNGLVITGLRLVDGGGNRGGGNRGEGQQRPAIQCSIGASSCQP
jgi:hypothetical protein